MRLSQKTLKKRFRNFNEKYFNNNLVMPDFKIGGSKDLAGCFLAKVNTNIDENGEKYAESLDKIKIYLSKRLLTNSHILDEILLHEMIHYYGYMMNEDIEGSHGDWFMSMAETINKDGYNISQYYD